MTNSLSFEWMVLLKHLERRLLKTWEEFQAFKEIAGKYYFDVVNSMY